MARYLVARAALAVRVGARPLRFLRRIDPRFDAHDRPVLWHQRFQFALEDGAPPVATEEDASQVAVRAGRLLPTAPGVRSTEAHGKAARSMDGAAPGAAGARRSRIESQFEPSIGSSSAQVAAVDGEDGGLPTADTVGRDGAEESTFVEPALASAAMPPRAAFDRPVPAAVRAAEEKFGSAPERTDTDENSLARAAGQAHREVRPPASDEPIASSSVVNPMPGALDAPRGLVVSASSSNPAADDTGANASEPPQATPIVGHRLRSGDAAHRPRRGRVEELRPEPVPPFPGGGDHDMSGATSAVRSLAEERPPQAPARPARPPVAAASRAADELFLPTDTIDVSPAAWAARLGRRLQPNGDARVASPSATPLGSLESFGAFIRSGRAERSDRAAHSDRAERSDRTGRSDRTAGSSDTPVRQPAGRVSTLHGARNPVDAPPDARATSVESLRNEPLRLSTRTRRFLAPLVGIDPSAVAVWQGPRSSALASAHRADAMTVAGAAIVMGAAFDERTPEGLGLLAHELTHVVRQRHPRFVPPLVGRSARGSVALADEEAVARLVESRVVGLARQRSSALAPPTRAVGSHASGTDAAVRATDGHAMTLAGAPEGETDSGEVPPTQKAHEWGPLPAPWEPLPAWALPVPADPAPTLPHAMPSLVEPALPAARATRPALEPAAVAPPHDTTSAAPEVPAAAAASAATLAIAAPLLRAESGRTLEQPAPPAPPREAPGAVAPDLDLLARRVYAVLKHRLDGEMRRERWS